MSDFVIISLFLLKGLALNDLLNLLIACKQTFSSFQAKKCAAIKNKHPGKLYVMKLYEN